MGRVRPDAGGSSSDVPGLVEDTKSQTGRHRFGPTVHTELLEDHLERSAHCDLGVAYPGRDLAIPQTGGHQAQDLAFLGRQRALRRRVIVDPGDEWSRQLTLEVVPTAPNRVDRLDELVAIGALLDVP